VVHLDGAPLVNVYQTCLLYRTHTQITSSSYAYCSLNTPWVPKYPDSGQCTASLRHCIAAEAADASFLGRCRRCIHNASATSDSPTQNGLLGACSRCIICGVYIGPRSPSLLPCMCVCLCGPSLNKSSRSYIIDRKLELCKNRRRKCGLRKSREFHGNSGNTAGMKVTFAVFPRR